METRFVGCRASRVEFKKRLRRTRCFVFHFGLDVYGEQPETLELRSQDHIQTAHSTLRWSFMRSTASPWSFCHRFEALARHLHSRTNFKRTGSLLQEDSGLSFFDLPKLAVAITCNNLYCDLWAMKLSQKDVCSGCFWTILISWSFYAWRCNACSLTHTRRSFAKIWRCKMAMPPGRGGQITPKDHSVAAESFVSSTSPIVERA